MHVVTAEETALIAITFIVAFASTLSRAIRDGDRRSNLRMLGLGTTSGFLAVGLYCIGADYSRRALGSGANLFWIGVAAFIGFTAQQQDKIGGSMVNAIISKVLGGAIAALSAVATLTKKQDDDKK